ncbi:MAG: KamA family radical SAM protein [Clostridia bacterium]|nr:KamA family radical SAM protein [Clostridia bacterium]
MITGADNLIRKLNEAGVRADEETIRAVDRVYPVRISEYYFGLIDWSDPLHDPIYLQCMPDARELTDTQQADPLNEFSYEVTPFLVHKYQSRAAFFCSNVCRMNCRHCTRKNTVMNTRIADRSALGPAVSYIKAHPEITDLLLTGGDPLALEPGLLEYYLEGFRPAVNTIRIGSRVIVTDPERITDELCDMLAKYHPLWVFTQFNHPREVTPEAAAACDRLLRRGIPLGNQSVLLEGINADADILTELYTKLIGIRVRPYYLYLCDRVRGTAHFYAPYRLGLRVMEELRYRLPGYAVPRLIIDADGENGGKVSIEPNHILEEGPDYLILPGRTPGTTVRYGTLRADGSPERGENARA